MWNLQFRKDRGTMMETGKYDGDDTAGRFIPVGFRPRHVEIAAISELDGGPRTIWKNDRLPGAAAVVTIGSVTVVDPAVELVPKGFKVSGAGANGANEAAQTYVWTA